jgi:hypothetical protein
MEQSALLLSWVVSSYWLIEPVSQRLYNEPARQTAAVAPRKVPMKAFVVDHQEDAVVQQFQQQYGSRFRQLYRSELHFLRIVCQPTKQQFDKIAADGEPALQATIRKIAATWRRPAANDQSDLRTLIVDALVKSVRSTLSPEQSTRYQKELDQRTAARKRVTVLNLVGNIDSLLLLTAEQRLKLTEILQNNWNESWNHEQGLTTSNRYFPPMPDNKILPVLNETQKQVWRDTPKGNIYHGFNPGVLPAIALDEEVWNDARSQKSLKRVGDPAAAEGRHSSKTVEKK